MAGLVPAISFRRYGSLLVEIARTSPARRLRCIAMIGSRD